MTEVRSPKFKDVDVDHPTIREYAANMVKQGKSREEIVKRIGMPHEVIERIERDVKRGKT